LQTTVCNVKTIPTLKHVTLIYSKGDFCLVLQAVFSSYSPVAYLDFTEGGSEGHVRFHTGESCDSVLKAMLSKSDKVKVEKLTGEAEKVYWEKINADRMARYNAKREKKRGSDKVARKADALQMQRQIHIRFDEEET